MTPQRAEEIVQEAIRDMVENPLCTPHTIKMVADHLRKVLAPLVKVETDEQA